MEVTDVDFAPETLRPVGVMLAEIKDLRVQVENLKLCAAYWEKRAAYYQEQRNQAYWSERRR